MNSLGNRAARVASKLTPVNFSARQRPRTRNEEQLARKDADKVQKALDLVGLIDPTGIADVTNMVGSLIRAKDEPDARGEHLKNAAVSAVGAIPVLGSMGLLGKQVKQLEARAKAGQITSRRGTAGNIARAAGMVAAKNPGTIVSLIRGLVNMATASFGRRGFGRAERADVYENITSAGTEMFGDIRSGRGAVDSLKEVTGNTWHSVKVRRRASRIRAIRAERGGDYMDSGGFGSSPPAPRPVNYGGWSYDTGSYPEPGTSFAMRSRGRGGPSWGRRTAGMAVGTWQNSPLAWAALPSQTGMRASLWAARTGPALAVAGAKKAATVVSRSGALGPIAAYKAGGWYFSPTNVASGIKGFGEGVVKATAATTTWTAAMRVANAATLAYQHRLVPFSGTMAAAYSRYQADEMRRNVQMGRLTGGSYAGLSRSSSALEDRTVPYRALGTNVVNRIQQYFTTLNDRVIQVADALPGVKSSVDQLNSLLGAGGTGLAPYHSLLHDIAGGKLSNKPTAAPR